MDRSVAAAFEPLPVTMPENLTDPRAPEGRKPSRPPVNEDEFFENPLRLRRR